jgi:hypothetical protein
LDLDEPGWLTRGVRAIGVASLLSDLGHEVPTSLLPSFLTATLGAPAAAPGLIEGIADGAAGIALFAGGPLAHEPQRRRETAGNRRALARISSWRCYCPRLAHSELVGFHPRGDGIEHRVLRTALMTSTETMAAAC